MYINQSMFIRTTDELRVSYQDDHPGGPRIRVHLYEVNGNFPDLTLTIEPEEAKELSQQLTEAVEQMEQAVREKENEDYIPDIDEETEYAEQREVDSLIDYVGEETRELIDADNRDRAADMRNY